MDFEKQIKELFKQLDNNNIEYAILHGWQDLHKEFDSDIDIIINRDDLYKLEKIFSKLPCKVVNIFKHESTGFYYILAYKTNNKINFLRIDAATDYRRNGRIFFTADELLKGRKKYKNIWILKPEKEFEYLLIKKILKQNIPENQKKRIKELINILNDKSLYSLEKLFGRQIGKSLFNWLINDKWSEFENNLKLLKKILKRQVLKQNKLNAIYYYWDEFKRMYERIKYHTGLHIAILGPDGSGKSTLINNLKSNLKYAFRNYQTFHFRPFVFQNVKETRVINNPHEKPSRNFGISILKIIYYYFDFWLGYWFKIKWLLIHSTLVIFDRYFDDILVDSKRYRYGGPRFLIKFLQKWIPKPDLYFILNSYPEELIHRKQELDIQEIKRQNIAYQDLADNLQNAYLIDANLPPDKVASHVSEIIVNHLHKRYLDRREYYYPENDEYLKKIYHLISPKRKFYDNN